MQISLAYYKSSTIIYKDRDPTLTAGCQQLQSTRSD